MLSQEEYVREQEQLYAAYLLAKEEQKEAIAEEMFLLYSQKEVDTGEIKLDENVFPQAAHLSFKTIPPEQKHTADSNKGSGVGIISIAKITADNFDDHYVGTDQRGNKVPSIKDILKDPAHLAKFIDAVNEIREYQLVKALKESGCDVKKVDKGEHIDFELTPQKSSLNVSALDERVRSVQDDAQSMKKTGKQSLESSKMTPMSDSKPDPNPQARNVEENMSAILTSQNDTEQANTPSSEEPPVSTDSTHLKV